VSRRTDSARARRNKKPGRRRLALLDGEELRVIRAALLALNGRPAASALLDPVAQTLLDDIALELVTRDDVSKQACPTNA